MTRTSAFRNPNLRQLSVLIALAVAVQGLLVVLPHDHATEAATPAPECDNPDCSAPSSTHLRRHTRVNASSQCLACAVAHVVFGGGDSGVNAVAVIVQPFDDVLGERRVTLSRRWQPLLRGPPQSL